MYFEYDITYDEQEKTVTVVSTEYTSNGKLYDETEYTFGKGHLDIRRASAMFGYRIAEEIDNILQTFEGDSEYES